MTKHAASYDYERAVCGAAGAYMRVTGDTLTESIEECDCLACLRVALRSGAGFRVEPDVTSYYEQQLRPRFIRLIRGVPGFVGDETFAEVLDKLADRLIPVEEPIGQPMLLDSIPVVSTPGWPEGTVTLLGSVPLFRSVVLPRGKRARVQSREPGLMVLVAYDDWSTELLPAQMPCLLLETSSDK